MGRTACTEPQCLYKGALYLFTFYHKRVSVSQCWLSLLVRKGKIMHKIHDVSKHFCRQNHWQRSNEDVVHQISSLNQYVTAPKEKFYLPQMWWYRTHVWFLNFTRIWRTNNSSKRSLQNFPFKSLLAFLFSISIYSNIYILNLISSSIHALRTSACCILLKYASKNVVSRLILWQYTYVANNW
jgi:hypothetical protein